MKPRPYHRTWDRKNKSRNVVPCFLQVPFQIQTIYNLKEEKLRKMRN